MNGSEMFVFRAAATVHPDRLPKMTVPSSLAASPDEKTGSRPKYTNNLMVLFLLSECGVKRLLSERGRIRSALACRNHGQVAQPMTAHRGWGTLQPHNQQLSSTISRVSRRGRTRPTSHVNALRLSPELPRRSSRGAGCRAQQDGKDLDGGIVFCGLGRYLSNVASLARPRTCFFGANFFFAFRGNNSLLISYTVAFARRNPVKQFVCSGTCREGIWKPPGGHDKSTTPPPFIVAAS